MATVSSLRWGYLSCIFPRLCFIGFEFAQPFLITRAINYVSEPVTSETKNEGYGLIAATAIIYIGLAVSPKSW